MAGSLGIGCNLETAGAGEEAVLGDLNNLIRKLYEVVEASEDPGDEATLDFAVEMLRD